MNHEAEIHPGEPASESISHSVVTSSIFSPIAHGWKPGSLPELATPGFPLAPPFIVKAPTCSLSQNTEASPTVPFGFRFRIRKNSPTHPVIDLTHGFYDPVTQVYTVPLRTGGDTEGDVFETGYWTDHGDGKNPNRSWDTMPDRESD